jgi:hypothetical protein
MSAQSITPLTSSTFFNIANRWWQFYTLKTNWATSPVTIQCTPFKDPKEVLFLAFKHDKTAKAFYLTTKHQYEVADFRREGEQWFAANKAELRFATCDEIQTWLKAQKIELPNNVLSLIDFDSAIDSDGKGFLEALKLTPGAFLETSRVWKEIHEGMCANKPVDFKTLAFVTGRIGTLFKTNVITSQQMAILMSEVFFEYDGEPSLFDEVESKMGEIKL